MTTANITRRPGRRALERAKRDPIVRALLTKQPEQIITHWNAATPAEKDDIMLRVVLLVAGLAREIDFN